MQRRSVRTGWTATMFVGLLALICASRADAFVRDGDVPPWSGSTVRYWVDKPAFRDEVAEAAKAINSSGARIRLRPITTRRGAQVIARRSFGTSCEGRTDYGPIITRRSPGRRAQTRRLGPTEIQFGECRAKQDLPFLAGEARRGTVRLIAHELLHALTLGHDDRRCALMNTSGTKASYSGNPVPDRCADVQKLPIDSYYCALMEPDDQRGLIAIYGGSARPLGPRVCRREPPPSITGITATPGVDPALRRSIVNVRWNPIGGLFTFVEAALHQGACPTDPASLTRQTSIDGTTWSSSDGYPLVLVPPMPGTWCASARTSRVLSDVNAIRGPVTSVTVEVPPSA